MRTIFQVTMTIDHACNDIELLKRALVSELADTVCDYDCQEMLPGNVEGEREQCEFRISVAQVGDTRCDAGEVIFP